MSRSRSSANRVVDAIPASNLDDDSFVFNQRMIKSALSNVTGATSQYIYIRYKTYLASACFVAASYAITSAPVLLTVREVY
jgi:hypothetical protein